jgi:hypothetical protein
MMPTKRPAPLAALFGTALILTLSACSDADLDHFWNSDAPAINTGGGSGWGSGSGLYNRSITTSGACARAGGTWNSGSGGCWRI